ncbi:MAG TPA: MarR family transcriptional regulator [Acidimicrobiia bacterium]
MDSLRASQTASDMMDEAFCDFLGINRSDGRCLDVVDRFGQVTAGELAKEVGLTTGAVTAMVDRLEAAELLRRMSDPDDRRKVLIELTPEAKKLAQEIYGHMAHATAPLIGARSDSDLLTLIAFFEASRQVNLELAARVRERAGARKASLRYRIEQAKGLKADAKELFKSIKSDLKNLVSIVVVSGGSRWEQDETGQWVEMSNEEPDPDE